MAKWLDKYEQGGLVLKKKTKDNYGKRPNPNDVKASVGPDFVGLGYNTKGRDYSPAWGGQFQQGGTLPEVTVYGHRNPGAKAYFDKVRKDAEYWQDRDLESPINGPMAEYLAKEQMYGKYGAPKINVIGEDDRPYYNPFTDSINIPDFEKDYEDSFFNELAHKVQANNKGRLGVLKQFAEKDLVNTFKNMSIGDIFNGSAWKDAYEKNYFAKDALENDAHEKIYPKLMDEFKTLKDKEYNKFYPNEKKAMGGGIPGAVGFTYARTAGSAPANGKYTKKTKASAQDGKVLSPDADDRSTLGFNTSDPAFQNVKSNAFVPFDKKDFEGIKQNMAAYMSSPLYMERLSKSIPDAENAKDTQQRRLNNLLSIKLNPKTVSEGSHYDRNQHRVNLGATDFIDNAVISHEIAHGTVPNLTTTYGKQNIFGKAASVVGDLFQPYEQFSNSELEKINVPLSGKITAPNFDYMMARKEEHYKPQGTKASAKTAANETYGDLTGMRQLLLDNGLTTEFGQELTPELFKKATENKRVMNSPAFKRMKLKFKDEDIIKMNNEVAQNNNTAPLTQAKKGKKIIKDDRGQWDHPGEVTEIGSPDITMQGVDYPVLGISDTGDTQMMYPDQDYKFDGEKVTEFPMKQNGGWLDKYKAQNGKEVKGKLLKNIGSADDEQWVKAKPNEKGAQFFPESILSGGTDLPEVVVTSTKPGKKLIPYDGPTIGPAEPYVPTSELTGQALLNRLEFEAKVQEYKEQKDKEFNQKYNRDSWDYHWNHFKKDASTNLKLAAIAGGITAAPYLASALGLEYTGAALATPIVGGFTGADILGVGSIAYGASKVGNTSESVRNAYNNPTRENILNAINEVGWNALDFAPAIPVVRTIGQEAKGLYNTVATGESALPIAWKSPAVGLSQESSADMFRGIANANKLSDADRALLLEYQYDSKPFTGRWGTIDQSKREALNDLIKNNELTINNNAILTRRFNPENQSLGAEFVGNKLNLGDRPTSFSAGIGLPTYGSGATNRLVVPNRYAKQMGNNLLANEYGIPSDETFSLLNDKGKNFAASIGVNPTDMINAEREVIGTGLDFRRIGKVKNDIGGYDYIVRPSNITKSTGTQSVTRGPINWWESPIFKKNNPNYNPKTGPPDPFPKYTAKDVPEELNPYLVIDDDLPDDYIELPDYNMKKQNGGWLNKYK